MDSILYSSSPSLRFPSHLPFTSFRPLPNHTLFFKPPRASFTLSANQQNNTVLSQPTNSTVVLSQCCLTKQLIRALFCFAVGVSTFGAFQIAPAFAIPTIQFSSKKKEKKNQHEYYDCTQKVLETVTSLLRTIEEVREGNGDFEDVKRALEFVKLKKDEMEREILERMHPVLMDLKEELRLLKIKEGEISWEMAEVTREYRNLIRREMEMMDKVVNEVEKKVLDKRMGELEKKWNEILVKIDEMEDVISRKETAALSYGVLEICFIERECEKLVERFKLEIKQKKIERLNSMIS